MCSNKKVVVRIGIKRGLFPDLHLDIRTFLCLGFRERAPAPNRALATLTSDTVECARMRDLLLPVFLGLLRPIFLGSLFPQLELSSTDFPGSLFSRMGFKITGIAHLNVQIVPTGSADSTPSLVSPVEHEVTGIAQHDTPGEVEVFIDAVRCVTVWVMRQQFLGTPAPLAVLTGNEFLN